jgi:hypothetical protein
VFSREEVAWGGNEIVVRLQEPRDGHEIGFV